MKKRNVLVITGTRAEYGLLLPIIRAIQKSRKLELRLLVTGMHTLDVYGHTIDEIRRDKVPISSVVPIAEKDSMLGALSKEIRGIERYCRKERPDILLVPSDRDEGFAGAIVAGHLGIPIAHYSGGDTSSGIVDEQIRHAISKFAHVHFPIADSSARRLLSLGEEKWRIHHFGTTALDTTRSLVSRSRLARMLRLDPREPWILFVQHPAPLDATPLRKQIAASIEALKRTNGQKIILYPNSDTGSDVFIRAIESLRKKSDVRIARSLPRKVYLSLLKSSDIVVGNSSSGIVEAGFFAKPVVDIGSRQRGRERGKNVAHAPYDAKRIRTAMARALSPAFRKRAKSARHPYGSGGVGKKIARALERLKINDRLLYKKI